jgi:hypothetical protein
VFGVVFDAYFDGGAAASQLAPLYQVCRTREEIHEQPGNALVDPHRVSRKAAVTLATHVDEELAAARSPSSTSGERGGM